MRELWFLGVSDAVCYGVSRKENWEAAGAASVSRQSLSRATGEARAVHSGAGLPGDSVVSGKRLFPADERQSGKSDAEFDPAAIGAWVERGFAGFVFSDSLESDLFVLLGTTVLPVSLTCCLRRAAHPLQTAQRGTPAAIVNISVVVLPGRTLLAGVITYGHEIDSRF